MGGESSAATRRGEIPLGPGACVDTSASSVAAAAAEAGDTASSPQKEPQTARCNGRQWTTAYSGWEKFNAFASVLVSAGYFLRKYQSQPIDVDEWGMDVFAHSTQWYAMNSQGASKAIGMAFAGGVNTRRLYDIYQYQVNQNSTIPIPAFVEWIDFALHTINLAVLGGLLVKAVCCRKSNPNTTKGE